MPAGTRIASTQTIGWVGQKIRGGARPRHHSPIRLGANVILLSRTQHLLLTRQTSHPFASVNQGGGFLSPRSGSERGWPGYFGDATRALAPGKRGTHCQYLNNRLGGPKNPGWGKGRVITHPSVSAQTSPSSGIPTSGPRPPAQPGCVAHAKPMVLTRQGSHAFASVKQMGGGFLSPSERQRARLARLLRRCNTRFSSWQAWHAFPVLKQSAGWAKKSGVGQQPRHHSPIRLGPNISQLRHTLHLAPGRQRNPAASPMQDAI